MILSCFLMELILRKDNLSKVYKQVKSNKEKKIIARLGYISMSDYYLKVCEN